MHKLLALSLAFAVGYIAGLLTEVEVEIVPSIDEDNCCCYNTCQLNGGCAEDCKCCANDCDCGPCNCNCC